jgi:site-specific DNA recombinase
VDRRLATIMATSLTAQLIASGERLRQRWEQMTPAIRSQVVDELVAVTINPRPKGLRRFNPAYVDVTWT